ncbi:MAG: TIGR00296 family protein [Candidatus Micrarchaeota archaeon]
MAELLGAEEGAKLVKQARNAVDQYLQGKEPFPSLSGGVFEEKRGIFVTLHTHPRNELRGCIGFIQAHKPLKDIVIEAAVHSALHDTRFQPVRKDELQNIVFEISVLTPPELMHSSSPEERANEVKKGTHGLIIEYGAASGLLLPQVAIEWNWNSKEFLEAVCQKAGLPRDMWKSASAKLYLFQAQIFSEETPAGKIVQKKLVA